MKYDNSKIMELYEQDMPANVRHHQVFRKTSSLVSNLTKRYKRFESHADITQEGYRALFGAIKSFNPEACPNFYGWAFLYVKRAVGRAAYSHKLYDEQFQLVASAEKLLEGEEAAGNPEDILFNIEKGLALEKASNRLGKHTNYIIRKLFGIGNVDPETILELQDSSRMSRHRICKIRDMGLQQLRGDLALFEALK